MRRNACTVQLYFHSPYGPYGLYRNSVPVQYSYTSTPPMGLRSLQSLSALHYSYISTPPMGRTDFTETQCLYSTAITPLPLWTVLPVHSLSAFTVQLYLFTPYGPYGLYRTSGPVEYSYTSTHPMDLTACTEPQCLYSTAIPLLPLWAVLPVQSFSACTVQLYFHSPYGP